MDKMDRRTKIGAHAGIHRVTWEYRKMKTGKGPLRKTGNKVKTFSINDAGSNDRDGRESAARNKVQGIRTQRVTEGCPGHPRVGVAFLSPALKGGNGH